MAPTPSHARTPIDVTISTANPTNAPVGFQNSVTCADQQVSRHPFVLIDQATKNRSTLDPFITEAGHGVGPSWSAKFAGAVRSSTVVEPNVLREHQTQVPLTKDQYPVNQFGSDRADEPFGKTIPVPACPG